MYTRDKTTASPVGSFLLGNCLYSHSIFCADDDRVELQDNKGNTLMTYTANCAVLDKDGEEVGRWNMDNNRWVYYNFSDKQEITFKYDLLEAEMEVSKMFLKGELK